MTIQETIKAQREYKERLKKKRAFYLDQFYYQIPKYYKFDDLELSLSANNYYLKTWNRV